MLPYSKYDSLPLDLMQLLKFDLNCRLNYLSGQIKQLINRCKKDGQINYNKFYR